MANWLIMPEAAEVLVKQRYLSLKQTADLDCTCR